jgi:hypothetical protein
LRAFLGAFPLEMLYPRQRPTLGIEEGFMRSSANKTFLIYLRPFPGPAETVVGERRG